MALTQWREIRGRMSVAMEVGVEAAILLEDIYYWVNHNREREHNFNEGYYWTVNSYQDFVNRFPCFSVGKIKRLLAQLKTAGFIEARHYRNYDPRNRSLWYRTTQKTAEHYTSLAEAANQRNGDEFDTFQGHKSDSTCASVKSDQCMSQNRPMHRTELHFPSILTNSTNIRAHTKKGASAPDISSGHCPTAFMAVEDEQLRSALQAFAAERNLHRKPISNQAATLLLIKLEKLAPQDINAQLEIINHSIINGWADFFPLPQSKNTNKENAADGHISPTRNLYEETLAKAAKLDATYGGNDNDLFTE
jgi:hypothetical protein